MFPTVYYSDNRKGCPYGIIISPYSAFELQPKL